MSFHEISFPTLILAAVLTGCGTPTPISGFKPLYPESVVEVPAFQTPRIRTVTVGSLQPTLKWEPLPSDGYAYPGHSPKPYVSVDLVDLHYELIIWKVVNGERGDVVYRVRNLTRSEHRVSESLAAGTVYFWSVRANFSINGKPRVTDWTISNWPCFGSFADICGRELATSTGQIHPSHYLRFKTPTTERVAHAASRAANPDEFDALGVLYRDGVITDEEYLKRRTQLSAAQAKQELEAMQQQRAAAAATSRESGHAPGANGPRRIAMAPPVFSRRTMSGNCDMDPERDFRIAAKGIASVIAVPARLPTANPQLAELWDHQPVGSTPDFPRVAASPAFADVDAVMLIGYHGTGGWYCIRVQYELYLLDRRSGQVTTAKADASTARQRMGELMAAWAGT